MTDELKTSLLMKYVSASFNRRIWTVMVCWMATLKMFLQYFEIYNCFKAFDCVAGQITLDEFIEGAQKSPWLQEFLQLDVNPSSWVQRYLCDRKLMGKDSWGTSKYPQTQKHPYQHVYERESGSTHLVWYWLQERARKVIITGKGLLECCWREYVKTVLLSMSALIVIICIWK